MDDNTYIEIRNSWILFAIRDILEKTDIRNIILQKEFDNKDIFFKIMNTHIPLQPNF